MSSNRVLSSIIPFEDLDDPEYYKYKWQITNFTENLDGRITAFTKFSIDGNDFTLFFTLYPKGLKKEDFLSIALNLFSQKKSINDITTYFCILDGTGEEIYDDFMRNGKLFHNHKFYNSDKFIDRKTLFDESRHILPGNVLTIIFSIKFTPCAQTSRVQSTISESRLGQYFDNTKFSDVIFDVEDQEFNAHKIILAFQSDVFAAMFEHNMEETKLNRVTITDVGAEVFKEMLNFIYTGNIPNLNKTVYDLLPLADKYNLEKLKVMCIENLFINISIENAIKTLLLAERHSVEDLKGFTEHFISEHIIEIMKTEDWKSLIQVQNCLESSPKKALSDSDIDF